MSGPGFIHLHVHSSFSLLEGALPLARLAELAKADKQPALALTDTNNMFAALEFSEKMAGSGIQPIIGCDMSVDFADQEVDPRIGSVRHGRLVLLAATAEGYRNLIRLTSRSFLDTPSGVGPYIKLDWLDEGGAGLIALSGGPTGVLDTEFATNRAERAATRCERLQGLFGDRFYVELQRHGMPGQRAIEASLIDLAYARGIPLVATNEPFFAREDDFEAHDALICIAEGQLISQGERRQMTAEHRFKTRADMLKLFADLPEALASTVEIARRCAYRPTTRKPILPRFTSSTHADADAGEAAELRRQAKEGLDQRIAAHGLSPGVARAVYEQRLDHELGVITRMWDPLESTCRHASLSIL